MKALTDLFTTDYGLMSVAGLAFIVGMAVTNLGRTVWPAMRAW